MLSGAKSASHRLLQVSILLLLIFPTPGAAQAGSTCQTTTYASYSVDVCIDIPPDTTTVAGAAAIQISVTVSGDSPGVQKILTYLDDQYLLTDFAEPFVFEIPTEKFVDGTYTLSVEAQMRDENVTGRAAISLTFNNGVTEPPVNNNTFTPYTSEPPSGQPYIVAALGDGASGEWPEVTDLVASWHPDMVLYLGDIYEKGTPTEFYNWYGTGNKFFAQFRAITNPTIGNHEYLSGDPTGYFDYWDNVPHYYSFDAAGWHFVTIDSNSQYDVTRPGTPQYEWLRWDLANNPSVCTIAFFHHPFFTLGPESTSDHLVYVWSLLTQYAVDVVLTGHDHNYQRWYPMDASGGVDEHGTTEFVVGVGGHGVRPFAKSDTRVAAGFDTSPHALGALHLELNAAGLTYQYINIHGSVLDSGAISCNGAGPDVHPPDVPTNLTAHTHAYVTLQWEASKDNTGVNSYTIYRDGQVIGITPPGVLTYTDSLVDLGRTYTYAVDAVDPAGTHSALSIPVTVTLPLQATLTLPVQADTYVDAPNPDVNYETSPALRVDLVPVQNAYLRFEVPHLPGKVIDGDLKVFAETRANNGFDLHLTSGNWDESTLTYNNAPPVGPEVGNTEKIGSGSWASIDITPQIVENSELNLVMVGSSNTAISFSNSDGANPPHLVIDLEATEVPTTTLPTESP